AAASGAGLPLDVLPELPPDLLVRLVGVPIGRDPHLALPAAELPRLFLFLDVRNELRHRLAAAGDHDLLAALGALDELREMRLRHVAVHALHRTSKQRLSPV